MELSKEMRDKMEIVDSGDMAELTDDDLIALETAIYNYYRETGLVENLGNFSEIIREQTIREE